MGHPVAVVDARRAALERVGAQVVQVREAQLGELTLPHADRRFGGDLRVLLEERGFPLLVADGHQVAVVGPVDELLARRLLHLALEERHEVVAVEVDLEVLAVGLVALLHLVDEVRLARGGGESGDQVLVGTDVVDHLPGFDHAGPADERRHAEGAFPVGRLLALERRGAAIGPGEDFGAVVGGVDDDGVVGDAEVVELLEKLADVPVVLDHAVGIEAEARLAFALFLQMREDVHAGRVVVTEERLVGLGLLLHPRHGGIRELVVDGLHSLDGQRAGVLDLLLADFAELRIDGGVVGVGGPGVHDPARAEFLLERGLLRVVGILGLFLGVEVIEVAEELVEPVDRRAGTC